jgi:LPS sulfotransferase NodH
VITHRDPVKVLPSVHNLMATLRWQRSDHVDAESLARLLGAAYPAMWNQVTEWRRSGAVPGDRIVDLHYSDLMADPLGAVAGLYDALGMELGSGAESAMARYLEVRPKGRHGVHSYSFDSLGLDPGSVRKEFQPYMDAYGVAPEQ